MDIDALDEKGLAGLADRLAPLLAARLAVTPTYFGSRSRVRFGRNVTAVNTLFNTMSGDIDIGDDVFFGHDVRILTGTHDVAQTGLARQRAVPFEGRNIVIGEGAWISSNATVVGPCVIGAHAVVGVGSVVLGDVRAGWFYAGVPARPIRPVVERANETATRPPG